MIDRLEGLGARFVVGLFRWFGRPLFRFFVIEDKGRPVATALLTFSQNATYLSGVVVDAPYRRRGFARQMLAACDRCTKAAGRRFVVLDVLEENLGARKLYDGWGYRNLRMQSIFALDLWPQAPAVPAGNGDGIRPFVSSDARSLAELLNAALPPDVRAVLPAEPGQFRVPRLLSGVLESKSEAWVALHEGAPAGFVRATVGGPAASANLTAPLLADDLPEELVQALLGTALRWTTERRARRVITEVPDHAERAVRHLRLLGFRDAFRLLTLVRSFGG